MQRLYTAGCYRATLLLLSLWLLAYVPALAQQGNLEISGQITNEKTGTVPGATVLLKGTSIGTSTNSDGQFALKVPAGATTLVVSYIGYLTQEVAINGRQRVDIVLAEDIKALSDVVVVGYGTQRRAEVTGAIASVKAEEITRTPVTNVAQGLQGRAAGVQITQNSSAPGGSISVRIRGNNSINGSGEPLYVIDGIQITNSASLGEASPLSSINPGDIESVEVLKDASATAIYGSLGANGVVLITTKRGKNGPSRVSYDGYYGGQSINKKLNLLNATQFAQLENEVFKRTIYADPASLGQGTDWQSLIFRKAAIQNHQVTVAGGRNDTQLALSLNYFKQDGVVLNSSFERYSVRLNLDHRVSDRVKVGASLFTSYGINNGVAQGPTNPDQTVLQSVLGSALSAPPTLVPYDANGLVLPFADQLGGRYREVTNPLGLLSVLNRTAVRRTLANVYGDVQLLPGLTYRLSLSTDLQSSLNDFYSPRSIVARDVLAASPTAGGSASKTNNNNTVLLHESTLTYAHTFAEQHSLKITAGISNRGTFFNTNLQSAAGFPNDLTTNEAIQTGLIRSGSSYRADSRLDSYLARVNYAFRGRYLLEILGRADGGSVFGFNNKYGFFPAASAGWRIIEEPFLQGQKVLSDLKLRASYGVAANGAAIGPYQSLSQTIPGGTNAYQLDHAVVIGAAPTIPNPDLRWERSYQANVGIDIAVLQNRLTFTADVYNKDTDGLLFIKPLPLSSGYPNITGNYARLRNRGVELAVAARILDGDFKWNVNGNISFNRNKLLALEGGQTELLTSSFSVLQVGQPLGIFKTYVADGNYQTGETVLPGSAGLIAGTPKVRDLNGDGQISAADQRITGNPNPDFTYGFSTDLAYKGFDFSLFASGVQGKQLYNLLRYSLEDPLGGRNLLAGVADRWTPTNPSNDFAGASQGGRLSYSDRFVEDGSFLRLRNITLGYTLPTFKGLYKARVYVSANNLYTFTKYSGYDPEVNIYGGSNTQLGVDNGVYPVAKSILGGLQVTF